MAHGVGRIAEMVPLAPQKLPPFVSLRSAPCRALHPAANRAPTCRLTGPASSPGKPFKEWRDAGCPPKAGFPEGARGRVARISKGDFLLCYLSSPDSAFVGVQEVVGTMRDAGSVIAHVSWGVIYNAVSRTDAKAGEAPCYWAGRSASPYRPHG
jgi:hypothetical protein